MLTRLALPEDVPALVELINLAYRVEEYFVAGDRTDAVEISSMMERGEFLVVDGSALDASHGVLNLAACVYLQTKAAPAYLGLLCVDPELQSHGLGRRLMEAGERRVLDKGACELDLLVVNLRTELVGWYLSQGYEEIGTEPFSEPRRLLEPCHFLRLRKALAQASVS